MARRILLGMTGLLVLVAVGLAFWEPLFAERADPPPPARYAVEIARDRFGVPHIFGRTDADVAFGIAYAHAEDDFTTQQQVVAMTRGRLGAITGEDGAKTDYVLHLLRARDTVARDYDRQPADVRRLLEGYAAGLNHYAAKHPGEVALSRLFPVNGRDVAAGFVLRAPFFFGLDGVLGALIDGKPPPAERGGTLPDAPNRTPAGPAEIEKGSNAWAVAPSRASDGHTRLVSNAHQPWRGAVAWYELVVHSAEAWDFAGATFPGAPFPLMGHNRTLGWTNTVNRPDLIDVYRLTMDAAGERYRFDGKWLPLAKRRVWLPVRMGPFTLPIPRTVLHSVHGPVIANDRGTFAVRYGGIDQLRMVEQYYRLGKARTLEQWQRVMAIQGVMSTNFVYADAAGNVGLFYNAVFPDRATGYDWGGVLPGDDPRALWKGSLPWARVPRNLNPASGYVMNANNTPFVAAGRGSELDPAAYSPLMGIERDMTNRAVRAVELMDADPSIGAAELEAIKFDTVVSPHSWAGQWFRDIAAVDPRGDADLARGIAVLGRWDWNYDGRGPADALAVLLLREGNKWHYQRQPRTPPRVALAGAVSHLMEHFGRIDVALGDLLRLRQGDVDLPLDGGPDVLRAMATWDVDEDGRLAVRHGDSFIMMVDWAPGGRVRSRSIQPFGAATTRPTSPHHTDQARLFAAHRFKPVWFDPAELSRHTVRRYTP